MPKVEDFQTLLSVDRLMMAWEKVRGNKGCSGGDNISITAFAKDTPKKLAQLSGRLRNGDYRPGPLRLHDIPKDDGDTRRLAIPCVADRIVQTAVAQALTPVVEARFHPDSFGYRPGRSVQMAIDRVKALRGKGFDWVVEADIDRAFDRIPHEGVLTALEPLDLPEALTDLIAFWLEQSGQELGHPGRGLAQGSPLSPLLANLFLDGLDQDMQALGFQIVRFADDFLLLTRDETRADQALSEARDWLTEHGLHLNSDGSRVVSFDRGFAFLGKLFVHSLTLDAPDDEEDAETRELMRDLAKEDEKDAKAARGGHDPGGRILYITEPGRSLHVTNASFVVKSDTEGELVRLAHGRVDRIELGPATQTTTTVLRHALRTGTDLVLTDGYGAPQGVLTNNPGHAAALHLAQARVVQNACLATDLARRIVEGRIRNQRARLQVLNRGEKASDVIWAAKELGRVLRKLPGAPDVAALRGYEGRAAAVYFPALGQLCTDEPAPFRRSRPGRTPLNAAINYLTALLERDCRAAVLSAGLHPGFGVLHAVQDRHEAGVWDVMEGFRALLTEGLPVALFRKGRLKPEMFETSGPSVTINSDGRRALIVGYESSIERPTRSHHSGNRVGLRRLMIEEARALAQHVRNPTIQPFAPQTQDY
ncbi:MAG: CRISPR-associated endonuclease Cas1 [Paracoccaceae bacterium]|nr:CRISPR-associated endonuclease Cas1 [Paracoccaceae bacterium]